MPHRMNGKPGGLVYHVVNRAAKRCTLFETPADFDAFEATVIEAKSLRPLRIFTYAVMRNHWHFVLSPENTGDLSRFMHWLTGTHAKRWQCYRKALGTGAVYQARFAAIPVQSDQHFLWVCRYVERNPLRANLVARAEDWPWSGLKHRRNSGNHPLADTWPIPRPSDWLTWVNSIETDQELRAYREAVRRRGGFGDERWSREMVDRGLLRDVRPPGRPRRALVETTPDVLLRGT